MMLLSSSFYLILFLTQFNRTQSNSYFCNNYEEDTEFEADDLTPVAFIQKTKEECLDMCIYLSEKCTGFTYDYLSGDCFLKNFTETEPKRIDYIGRVSCVLTLEPFISTKIPEPAPCSESQSKYLKERILSLLILSLSFNIFFVSFMK